MSTLKDRLAEFIIDQFPNERVLVELLCRDHVGTYVIPFPCRLVAKAWHNSRTDELIEAEVAGWRPWEE